MRITALDIRKQEFRKVMRGVDSEEVYAFLTTVAEEYEAALSDNKALRERVLELDDKVQEYRTMERTLRDTLLTAERATADARQNAQREADLIIKEAQIEAEKTLRDIKNQMMKLRQEVQSLQRERESYLARMKMLAESFLKFIDREERQYNDDEAEDAKKLAEPESTQVPLTTPVPKDEPSQAEAAGFDPPYGETPTPEKSSEKPNASLQATVGTTLASAALTPENPADLAEDPVSDANPEPGENTESESSVKTALPDLNSILDRMVREQKEILNETSTQYEPPNMTARLQQPASAPVEPQPTTIPVEPQPEPIPAKQQPAAAPTEQQPAAAPADQQPPASEEKQKEWSLEQLKKDIISE
jgi:cell division initiation protein